MGTQDTTDTDELSGLTEDERAQLAELDDADAGHGDASGASDEGETGGDDDQGGQQGDATGGADVGAGDGGTAADDEQTATTARVEPIYQAQAGDNLDQQLKDLAQARRDARRKYEEGELSEDQYDAELDRIEQERDKVNSARIRAEVSADMTTQQLQREYRKTLDGFFADIKKAGFDYKSDANKGALQHLDKTIKALSQTADGEEGPELWREILGNAHMVTAAKFKIPTQKAAGEEPGKDGKTSKAAEVARSRTPDLSKVPPTVGRGPSAGTPSVNSDEFSHLDGLSGIALERAVARLTPDQQERWEAAE